jgi:hypothetical protein
MPAASRRTRAAARSALPARLFAYRHPEAFARLIDILVDASASYLVS